MRNHSSAALLGDDCSVMNNAQVSVGHHGLCVLRHLAVKQRRVADGFTMIVTVNVRMLAIFCV